MKFLINLIIYLMVLKKKNKQILLLFFFFKLLLKNNKFKFFFLQNYIINLKYSYYYILNLLRISNIELLIFYFQQNNFYLEIFKIIRLIELDLVSLWFTTFKSNFFCNWYFFNFSCISYENFNLRVDFFLYLRYYKYIEYFRAFKYYEY